MTIEQAKLLAENLEEIKNALGLYIMIKPVEQPTPEQQAILAECEQKIAMFEGISTIDLEAFRKQKLQKEASELAERKAVIDAKLSGGKDGR